MQLQNMTQEEKLKDIINWYSENIEEETKKFAIQENFQIISDIEELIGESLPQEILNLFEKNDGNTGNGYGSFFGKHSLSLTLHFPKKSSSEKN